MADRYSINMIEGHRKRVPCGHVSEASILNGIVDETQLVIAGILSDLSNTAKDTIMHKANVGAPLTLYISNGKTTMEGLFKITRFQSSNNETVFRSVRPVETIEAA